MENPGLVCVRISGYGQTGPYRDRTGFDGVALGFSGMTYVTGDADRPPVRPGYFVADYGTGAFAAYGVVLALRARELTGRGQDVDLGLFEAPWRMSGTHLPLFGLSGENRERSGNYYPGVVPAEQFETRDGNHLIINATTQRPFERLCDAIGHPELVSDPRFTPREALVANAHEIHAIIRPWVAERTLEETLAVLGRYAVPCTKVYATSDIVGDPQYRAREQVLAVEAPDGTTLLQPGIVPRLIDTPGQIRRRAPRPASTTTRSSGPFWASRRTSSRGCVARARSRVDERPAPLADAPAPEPGAASKERSPWNTSSSRVAITTALGHTLRCSRSPPATASSPRPPMPSGTVAMERSWRPAATR